MLDKSITESHEGVKQSETYLRLAHCLDALRQETICNADDVRLPLREKDICLNVLILYDARPLWRPKMNRINQLEMDRSGNVETSTN